MQRPVLLGVLLLVALATAVAILSTPDTGADVPASASPGLAVEADGPAPVSLAAPPDAPEQVEAPDAEPVAPDGVAQEPEELEDRMLDGRGPSPEILAIQEARKAPHGQLAAGQLSTWTTLLRALRQHDVDEAYARDVYAHVKALQMARLSPNLTRVRQLQGDQAELLADPRLGALAGEPDVRILLDRLAALDAQHPLD
ncbi:MAG: hypothetical protein H6732_00530 [Alphaproteobacteria bacterium]|nr:hypothetical protein [Alphaproteobacteria bacterium]